MEEKILISVVMSEYNTNPEWLDESIKSILNQTYKNFEFLIIDDCSTNNMELFVKRYNDSRIKVLKNETNMGLAKSLNKGIEIAKGKYIARMDTDDISYEGRFKEQLKFLEDNKEFFLVSSRADMFDGKNIYGTTKDTGEVKKEDLINSSMFVHPTVMMRRDIVTKLNGYPLLKRCEDYGLWCNAYLQGYKGYILFNVLLKYRVIKSSYKKRGIKTRGDYIKLIYWYCKKLRVPIWRYFSILKVILAGIIPENIMYLYHKNKFKNL